MHIVALSPNSFHNQWEAERLLLSTSLWQIQCTVVSSIMPRSLQDRSLRVHQFSTELAHQQPFIFIRTHRSVTLTLASLLLPLANLFKVRPMSPVPYIQLLTFWPVSSSDLEISIYRRIMNMLILGPLDLWWTQCFECIHARLLMQTLLTAVYLSPIPNLCFLDGSHLLLARCGCFFVVAPFASCRAKVFHFDLKVFAASLTVMRSGESIKTAGIWRGAEKVQAGNRQHFTGANKIEKKETISDGLASALPYPPPR